MKKNFQKFILAVLIVALCVTCMGAYVKPETQRETAQEIASLARDMGLSEDDPMVVRAMQLYMEAEDTATLDSLSTETQKDMAHAAAELARGIGLPEDDPIIQRASQIWWDAHHKFENDRDIIATVVYNEGWYGTSERHKELIAACVVNRVNSDRFPNTVYDVVVQKNQYHPAYAQADSYYGRRARQNAEAWATCQAIAARALNGEIDCPSNVVFQANFPQGSGTYETHYTSYSTTWFCYL